MPEPEGRGSAGYLWLYRFLHTTAGNVSTAALGSRIPGFKIVGPLLLAPLVFPTAACAARYQVHPGALNVSDSAAYDTLLIAEAAIDQARMENQTGHWFLQRRTRSTRSSGPTTWRGIRG